MDDDSIMAISSLGLRMIIEVQTSILAKSLYVDNGANMALLKFWEEIIHVVFFGASQTPPPHLLRAIVTYYLDECYIIIIPRL